MDNLKFKVFLKGLETRDLPTNTTALGSITIQQTTRNELRREGLAALKDDLERLYGDQFDIVETKDGIVIAVEADAGYTISWELKSTIKGLDYDPFEEANKWDDEVARNQAKKANREAEREAEAAKLAAKRASRMAKANHNQA